MEDQLYELFAIVVRCTERQSKVLHKELQKLGEETQAFLDTPVVIEDTARVEGYVPQDKLLQFRASLCEKYKKRIEKIELLGQKRLKTKATRVQVEQPEPVEESHKGTPEMTSVTDVPKHTEHPDDLHLPDATPKPPVKLRIKRSKRRSRKREVVMKD